MCEQRHAPPLVTSKEERLIHVNVATRKEPKLFVGTFGKVGGRSGIGIELNTTK
jgi:hypothetical protein